nr:NAD(P)-dependent alcohol dehydrogenase [Chelatococcus sp. YT9]
MYELYPSAGDLALHAGDRPDPVPGVGEVLIEIHAAALNYRDLVVARNDYRTDMKRLVPMSDGAGTIVGLGPGATRFPIGARVSPAFYPDWREGPITAQKRAKNLGGTVDGVLSQLFVANEETIVAIPDHMSFEEAATLPCAALTAWNALADSYKLSVGETVLLQGSGGVSVFALQFAKAMGAEVIHLTSSIEKAARLRHLGADHIINYRETADWDSEVTRITNGRGVDVVVEVGGTGTLQRSIRAARVGGTIVTVGFLDAGNDFDPRPMIPRAIRLLGMTVGSVEMFQAMNRALALHKIRPIVARTFEFDEAQEAYASLARSDHTGKLVIRL